MGLKLFDDVGSDGEVDKIEIDDEFARRFEHNKKREDLQRLAEFKKKGIVTSDSDSESLSSEEVEEEDGGKKKDLEFFDALIRVKNQDPVLKDKEAKLFASDSETDYENAGSDDAKNKVTEDDETKGKKKKKPMYLKDVMSKHLIEEGPEFDDDEGTEEKVKTYSEEQEELRKAFLKAVEEEEGDGDGDGGQLLREKIKGGDDDDEDVGIVEKLNEYFGADDKLDEDTIFLKDYFRKRMWLDKGENKSGMENEEDLVIGVSEDEDEIDRQEDYEREFNFRFEENAGDRVLGHSRVVEDSVRKKPNARKLQRERKEERMAQAEFERKEELKHLKNVKKKEMTEKLRKIRETAGIGEDGAWLLDMDDLEEDFNPDEHDKKMKKTFDESYYEADDIDPYFGSENDDEDGDEFEKPDFDKEDELLRLSKGWDDVSATADGFLSARERVLKQKMKLAGEEKDVTSEDDEEDGKRKRKRKRKLSQVEKAVREELMEEYHKLEYEDTIGDLKTRFKYKPVRPRKYGLDSTEILAMDDKELNQYVSLKKLAPYRETEWKVPRIKTQQQRQKIKHLQEGVSYVAKAGKYAEKPSSSSAVSSKQPEEMNADTSNLSWRIKRRRRLAELKLSRSTLMAYGKISAKPKSKKKP